MTALMAGTTKPDDPKKKEDFSKSMAAAIEKALTKEWPKVMGEKQSVMIKPDFELLCIAVAQGVIKHLKDNAGAIKVTVTLPTGGTVSADVKIETEGTLY